MDNKLRSLVKEIKYRKDWNTMQVAKSIGYSREYLTTEMNKGDNDELINRLTDKHKDILQNVSTSSEVHESEPPYKTNEAKEQGLTMQALVNLTESNRTLADSNKMLAASHQELVMMLKSKTATVDADSRIPLETVSTLLAVRKLAEQLAVKVNRRPLQEVQDSLDKTVMELMRNLEHKDSVAVEGKLNKG